MHKGCFISQSVKFCLMPKAIRIRAGNNEQDAQRALLKTDTALLQPNEWFGLKNNFQKKHYPAAKRNASAYTVLEEHVRKAQRTRTVWAANTLGAHTVQTTPGQQVSTTRITASLRLASLPPESQVHALLKKLMPLQHLLPQNPRTFETLFIFSSY